MPPEAINAMTVALALQSARLAIGTCRTLRMQDRAPQGYANRRPQNALLTRNWLPKSCICTRGQSRICRRIAVP